jgi:hypothetical protein
MRSYTHDLLIDFTNRNIKNIGPVNKSSRIPSNIYRHQVVTPLQILIGMYLITERGAPSTEGLVAYSNNLGAMRTRIGIHFNLIQPTN